MSQRSRGVGFVTIDDGEGGTGASPMVFADSVSLPFRIGFRRVYKVLAEAGLQGEVTFIGGGKLGRPENAVVGPLAVAWPGPDAQVRAVRELRQDPVRSG